MAFLKKTPTTVDEVMAAFTSTIANLEGVAETNEAQSRMLGEQAKDLQSMAGEMSAEAERARSISAKLRGIVN